MRRLAALALASLPLILALTPQTPPKAEDVYKDIKVLKGVPAADVIPIMELMNAAMNYKCVDCHDAKDYAANTRAKETTRNMVTMQNEINEKNFNGKVEVTCVTCHRGDEHPSNVAAPKGVALRHELPDNAPEVDAVFAKHIAALGPGPATLTRTGTLTAPNDETHKVETVAVEFVQSKGGKFSLVSGKRRITSDGKTIWYGGNKITDEAAAIFGRLARSWRGATAFDGLDRKRVIGDTPIGKEAMIVARGTRAATNSSEELYFDAKTSEIRRLVNIRRTALGTVVSNVDYSAYSTIAGIRTPMKVAYVFPDGTQWILDFKAGSTSTTIDESKFKP
ncbi:MAG: photosynthetic reaction center cytochrome c subunit family protein [Fimbriimonas sp.]